MGPGDDTVDTSKLDYVPHECDIEGEFTKHYVLYFHSYYENE